MTSTLNSDRLRRPRPAGPGLGLLGAVLAAMALALPGAPTAAEEGANASAVRHVWVDPEGEPLPFQTYAEIEAFLRTADVVGQEEIGIGINRLNKLLVEKDGVRAHAIFRTIDEEHERIRVGDRFYMRFRDSWAHECAAYAVVRLFELDNIPPTVQRRMGGQMGSMQIWVENGRDHTAADFRPPSPIAWVQQTWAMFIFDNLAFNADRNTGNILAGEHYKLWLIDHTRAFQPVSELMSPDKVERLRRTKWARLREISEAELADATREYLDPDQIAALKARRALLIEYVEARIEELGEAAVLY